MRPRPAVNRRRRRELREQWKTSQDAEGPRGRERERVNIMKLYDPSAHVTQTSRHAFRPQVNFLFVATKKKTSPVNQTEQK